jgi:hypothetical protein
MEGGFYYQGRFFPDREGFLDFVKDWPDLPVDLEQYRKFLDDRYREVEMNVAAHNGDFTNRHAYFLMYTHVQWAKGLD